MRSVVGDGGDLAVLLARQEQITGNLHAVLALTDGVLDGSRSYLVPSTLIEAHMLAAVGLVGDGNRFRAIEALHAGVAVAAKFKLGRTVVDAGRDPLDLIAQEQGTFGNDEGFVKRIRDYDAIRRARRDGPESSLSERERLVLRHLPSLRTADEIASDLLVSVNTIKTQLGAIYRKLGARNRREAVAEARRRGLL
jgi:LuxR family maltose regulon positive regulatory protein